MTQILSEEDAGDRVSEYFDAKIQLGMVVARPPKELLKYGKDRDDLIERMLSIIDKLQARLEKLFNLAIAERETTALAFEIKVLHEEKNILKNNRNDIVGVAKAFVQISAISLALGRVYDPFVFKDT